MGIIKNNHNGTVVRKVQCPIVSFLDNFSDGLSSLKCSQDYWGSLWEWQGWEQEVHFIIGYWTTRDHCFDIVYRWCVSWRSISLDRKWICLRPACLLLFFCVRVCMCVRVVYGIRNWIQGFVGVRQILYISVPLLLSFWQKIMLNCAGWPLAHSTEKARFEHEIL